MRTLCIALALAVASLAVAQMRIACVGDSITRGRGGEDSYPAQLQKLLGDSAVVGNFGRNSATVCPIRDQQYAASPECAEALRFQPDIVIVMLGVNDSPDSQWTKSRNEFVPDLESLIQKFQALPISPRPRVMVCSPLPVFFSKDDSRAINLEEAIRPLVGQAARETGCPVIRGDALFEGQSDFFPDQLHPNRDGMGLLADLIANEIAPKAVKAGWHIVSYTDDAEGEGPAKNAIDGDPTSYWHSKYDPKPTKNPHELVIDLGQTVNLFGCTYLPRQDGGSNGMAKDYAVYVSDSTTFGRPVAQGAFGPGSGLKTARFYKPVSGRYLRFLILSEQSGGPYASAAEIGILRIP